MLGFNGSSVPNSITLDDLKSSIDQNTSRLWDYIE